jgi:hypothetical protein
MVIRINAPPTCRMPAVLRRDHSRHGRSVSILPVSDEARLPEVAYYYPAPYWQLSEVDWVKTLLLFFDRLAILLPRYMRGREVSEDPALAGPLEERGLLAILEPEKFIDQEMAEALTMAMTDLIAEGAFDKLEPATYYAELSQSRLGWDADVDLASMIVEELKRRDLARPSENGVSVPLHPTVRTVILVLLSQLARQAGERHGMHLHPVTSDLRATDGLIQTLSLSPLPSAGHIVTLDLETVTPNLASVPLDEILDFRAEHGPEYRAYARDLRRTIAELSPLPPEYRVQLLMDRREELADKADALRKVARRAWKRPLANVAMGAAGAAWQASAYHDPLGAALAFGTGVLGAADGSAVDAGAYSYLFSAYRELAR